MVLSIMVGRQTRAAALRAGTIEWRIARAYPQLATYHITDFEGRHCMKGWLVRRRGRTMTAG